MKALTMALVVVVTGFAAISQAKCNQQLDGGLSGPGMKAPAAPAVQTAKADQAPKGTNSNGQK